MINHACLYLIGEVKMNNITKKKIALVTLGFLLGFSMIIFTNYQGKLKTDNQPNLKTPNSSQGTEIYTIADISILHSNLVDKSAAESIPGEWTFGAFPITPSSAPDADYEVANMKYVDDQIAGGGYSDDEARAANTYNVTTENEFNTAITAIGTGFGIIRFYAGTILLTAALNVNGGGSYIIEGYGDKTIIDVGGDWKAFYVTSAESCVLRNFKIDATDLTWTMTRVIDVTEVSDNQVIVDNVTVMGDGSNGLGIYLGSDNCIVKNCWVQGVFRGIYLDATSNNAIIGNTAYSNDNRGIYLSISNYNTINENLSYNNSRDGIYLVGSSHNAINGNICRDNTYVGIYLYSSSNNNNVTGNICYSNDEEGIYIRTSHNNTISGNACNANGTNGIWLYYSDNNTITGNTCNDNDLNDANVFGGIFLSGDSDNNTIIENTSNNNNNIGAGIGHGIHIADSICNNNRVGGNTLLGNDVNYNDSGTDTILLDVDTYDVTAPDSSSEWETGSTQSITWTSTGTISDVKIELYKGGVFEMEIVANTTNDGEFSWLIPTTLVDSTQYQIKISDVANPATNDFSDNFEIFTSIIDSLTVTTPDSLTVWETETTQSITWTSTGTISDVKIELYKGGVFEMEIVASTANDGTYNWGIPTDLEDGIDYQIRISDVLNPATYDESPNFAMTSADIPDEIPGYNLYFVIGIMCVVSVILFKKRFKLIK